MAKNEYEDRIESEAKLSVHVTDNMLTCRDCMFKNANGKASKCEVYEERKPLEVLNGGECVAKTVE